MIPPLARPTRLMRQIQLTRCLCPSFSISPARRHIFTSIPRLGEDASKSPLNDATKTRDSKPRNPEQSAKDAKPQAKSRPTSRLAALKNRKSTGDAAGAAESTKRLILGYPEDKPIRTRFAPSPTGYLHLGSLRTALFCNLVAKGTQGGEFIIRIEDTDQNRLVPDAEERIFKDLEWAGLSWDEGPDKGGPYGPYRQSERLETYHQHTQTLLSNGSAYRCFCTPEHLEAQKRALHDAGRPTAYPGTCRTVPGPESDRRAAAGEPHVVRLDSARFGTPGFRDAIYGPFQKKEPEEDFVLMKTDGFPTYHLANVVDDHLMKITHVIRGEEWLISTPKHLALYQAFGWTAPTFAHLGLLVSDDGSKLSKRNDSVNLSTYRAQRVFPVAMQAWLANLGSSFKRRHDTPRTLEDVVEALTFKFTRGGIKLNPQKLDHFQWEYTKLLFKTSPLTPLERSLVQDTLLSPLLAAIHATTADPSSALVPAGTSLPWSSPLTPVPSLSSSPTEQLAYLHAVVSREATRYRSAADLALRLPYFFWRPPPVAYRASLAATAIPRALFDALDEAVVHASSDWTSALDRFLAAAPADQQTEAHSLLRLVAIGSPDASGKPSRVLFGVLGQEEWRARTCIVRELWDELEKGGPELRQRWQDEAQKVSSNSDSP